MTQEDAIPLQVASTLPSGLQLLTSDGAYRYETLVRKAWEGYVRPSGLSHVAIITVSRTYLLAPSCTVILKRDQKSKLLV